MRSAWSSDFAGSRVAIARASVGSTSVGSAYISLYSCHTARIASGIPPSGTAAPSVETDTSSPARRNSGIARVSERVDSPACPYLAGEWLMCAPASMSRARSPASAKPQCTAVNRFERSPASANRRTGVAP